MERICVKGNTWYLKGRQLIPYYQLPQGGCILVDPGRESEREDIAQTLAAAGLTPVGILLTHMHYDHHVNTKYFKERYGIPAAMPRGEAEICRSQAALKNHLFCFTPGLIAATPRLSDLVCPIERPIEWEEERITFCGAEFGVIHSPGHAPDHICLVTPDEVCLVGDAIMCGEALEQSDIPFCFGVALDLESKKRLLRLDCARYVVAHSGVLEAEAFSAVVAENIALIERQLAYMKGLITGPTTLCGCYEIINQAMGQAGGHPLRNHHLERYLRPYLEYLADRSQLNWVTGHGAPTLAPAEWQA